MSRTTINVEIEGRIVQLSPEDVKKRFGFEWKNPDFDKLSRCFFDHFTAAFKAHGKQPTQKMNPTDMARGMVLMLQNTLQHLVIVPQAYGYGLKTLKPIKKGQLVLEYTGEVDKGPQFLPGRHLEYGSGGWDGHSIDASKMGGYNRFPNHAPSRANLEKHYDLVEINPDEIATANIGLATQYRFKGFILFKALRDIPEGLVYFDYGDEYWTAHPIVKKPSLFFLKDDSVVPNKYVRTKVVTIYFRCSCYCNPPQKFKTLLSLTPEELAAKASASRDVIIDGGEGIELCIKPAVWRNIKASARQFVYVALDTLKHPGCVGKPTYETGLGRTSDMVLNPGIFEQVKSTLTKEQKVQVEKAIENLTVQLGS